MHAALPTSGNVFACPVFIVGRGLQGQVNDLGHRETGPSCPLCADTGTVSIDNLLVVAQGAGGGNALLDPADACWEDAEWR